MNRWIAMLATGLLVGFAAAQSKLRAEGPAPAKGAPAESAQTEAAKTEAAPDEAVPTGAAPVEVDADVAKAEAERIAAVDKAVPAVLAIFAPGGQGGGSGVVISPDGYALTNFHVAKPCGNFMKCGMADGKLYDAVLVSLDPVGDVALIKLSGRDDFPTAEIVDSDKVRPGDWCFAIGNPFLLATDFYPSVSWGVVSGVHRYQYPAGTLLEYADCLQVDAAINPGNSGGPLFDGQGRLIGINGRGSFEKRGRVNVGVGYAISINQIKNFLGHLHSGKILDHATLGARVATSDDGRVLVSEILADSDAARRGLKYDDEIVAFGGRSIRTVNALKNVLGIFPKGWRVPISYRRDGQTHHTYVRLMGVHGERELLAKVDGPKQQKPKAPRLPEEQPKPDGKSKKILPKRGDKLPDEKKPDGEQPDGEQQQKPDEAVQEAVKTPIAEEVKKQFEARRGYANFYFNRLNVDRIWKNLSQRADFAGLKDAWLIAGQVKSGGQLAIQLADDQCVIDVPTSPQPIKTSVTADLGSVLDPPGSGGLLSALYLWRKMLVGGPGRYGQVVYEGTAPLVGRDGLFDVLLAIGNGVESRFYFDPTDGTLVCLEMWPGEAVDPCEVYFSDYRESAGHWLPYRLEVRHGDRLYDAFTLTQYEFQPVVAK